MYLSVVLPVRNEEKNLVELHDRLLKVCESLNKPFEIIYVENGSTDDSLNVLKTLRKAKIIVLRWKKYMRTAQSVAMDAGFKAATGDNVIYMDSDLQIYPEVIPEFLAKLEEGFEVVCGWRKVRKEIDGVERFTFFKNFLRSIFVFFRKILINEGVHDPGSAIKAFKREALVGLDLSGEMHRYIIALLHWQGYEITEIVVEHHPRVYGKSNYTVFKGVMGFADLISVFIWRKYADRPLHYLGVGGIFVSLLGGFSLVTLLTLRIIGLISLKDSILPVISVLLLIVGVQLFVSGILADSLSKILYGGSKNQLYKIKEEIVRE